VAVSTKTLGGVLTSIGFAVMLACLYGAWREREPWDWVGQLLWTIGILAGAAVTLVGYRRLHSDHG
jgi:hypothetical protein